ncbi:MAG: hypothetical protein ACD_4C00011G0002 [uncultured bacterium (gcode 4)]|uniref:Uncharacterized protein n=1 Tax=uncultured bacterium (gcode 4) TaxID=1234023 RepID=K2GAN2_9BACT|nr:MAG: hypothetical protein ACD_4C00011G0002 [uncultured bacterium (gcode 4)]
MKTWMTAYKEEFSIDSKKEKLQELSNFLESDTHWILKSLIRLFHRHWCNWEMDKDEFFRLLHERIDKEIETKWKFYMHMEKIDYLISNFATFRWNKICLEGEIRQIILKHHWKLRLIETKSRVKNILE